MENINGVLWDGIFYYKDLTNAVKLSHQQMNHNFEMVASLSQNMTNQVDMSAQSAAEALASQRAAALSETAANNAKTAAESAKNTAVSANTSAQSAKTAAETAKNTAVSANTSAQSAKTAAESARDAAVTARNTAQSSATTATNAKTAAETARTTATQKATEASASAAAAAQSASEAKESASAVTSVQGKQGIVNLARADFSWMGSAAEKNVGINNGDVITVGSNLGFGSANAPLNLTAPNAADAHLVTSVVGANGPALGGRLASAGGDGGLATFAGRNDTKQLGWLGTGATYIRGNDDPLKNPQGPWSPWEMLWTDINLPQATQAEINADTQTPRLFSPKQLSDTFAAKRFKKMIITESGEVAKPTDGPMIIVLYGGGGRGNSHSSYVYRGGTGSICVVYVLNSIFIEETFPVLVAAPGGRTEALGYIAGGGSNASTSVHGKAGEVIEPQSSFFLMAAENGRTPPSSTGYREPFTNPVREGLADPSLYGFGGFSSGSTALGGPGLIEIYY